MSGILAILGTGGTPIDDVLASRMTESMRLFGPDRRRTWREGRVALGHALFRTTFESAREEQPFSLDGLVHIVADGRVDARTELVQALAGGHDRRALLQAPDCELMLLAYLRWGEACVDRLLGDFAFAIWDAPRQRLFCARDHMGIKPLFYAHVGPWVLVASTIQALRLHPAVSSRLNDLAIADFLLFGGNQDHGTTVFDDIRQVPPAHTLTWSDSGGLSEHRYWTLPIEEPLFLRRTTDYVEQYRELLGRAVSDRLRTPSVGVFLSGGLDSSALAATATALYARGTPAADHPVRGFTMVADSFDADPEAGYARMVAEHLQIPINFALFDRGATAESVAAWRAYPEPTDAWGDLSARRAFLGQMATHSPVALYGEGPDNALDYEWQPYLRFLWKRKRWGRLLTDVLRHVAAHRRVPLLPTIPRMIRDRQKEQRDGPLWAFPNWLSPDLMERYQLTERWRRFDSGRRRTWEHPVRPRGYSSMLHPLWQRLFATLEPAIFGVSLELRHPYFDLRVLGFLLRVPALPWCRAKLLQSELLRGMIPEGVRRRPKTPLFQMAGEKAFMRDAASRKSPVPELARFVDFARLSENSQTATVALEGDLRVAILSWWLSGDNGPRAGTEI